MHLIQIYVCVLHSDLILPVTKVGFIGACDNEGKVFIGGTSLRKYTLKQIKSTVNRNNISRACEKCIISMSLQPKLNK